MSKIKFKQKQLDIINSEGKNLLVSASAGSGKTTVMIARILKLLKEGKTSVSNLLVLTYTTNSAAEMKQKLLKSLKEESGENEFLEEQIDELDLADISTIHSFCQRLIKKNFHLIAGLDPAFGVLSAEKTAVYKAKAIEEALEEYKQKNNKEYLRLLKIYGKNRNDDKIKSLVFVISNFLDSYLEKDEFRKNIAFVLYEQKEKAFEILNENLVYWAQNNTNKFKKLQKQAEDRCLSLSIAFINDVLSGLGQIINTNTYIQNIGFLTSYKYMQKHRKPEDEDFYNNIYNQRQNFRKYITKQKGKKLDSQEVAEKSFESNAKTLESLLEIEKLYENKYSNIKKQNNVLDFSDLERHAIALTKMPEVKADLQSKYDHIFVDEYQDANAVQEFLINNIARQNNKFMVGDVKQSIYGFRRSNPQIFLDTIKKYENEAQSQNKNLNLNFRSEEQILNFVNQIFSVVMTEGTGKINFSKNARFEAFNKKPNTSIERVKVSVAVKDESKKSKTPTQIYNILQQPEEDDEEVLNGEKEALLVAKDIYKLKNHYLFTNKKDEQGNFEKRDVSFSDMTVLVRKRGAYFEAFCNKLEELGVPIYANSSTGLFDEPDSQRLIALLKLTQNFYDDYSLSQTMLSFVGGFNYQELADIRIEYPNQKFFYEAVLTYSKEQKNELARKINLFITKIQTFSQNCIVDGVYLSLINFLNLTEYKTKTLAFKDGEKRVAVINKFVSIFKNKDFDFNVNAFLHYAKISNAEIKSPDYNISGQTDCVNITTIHSSKGLEYPIVFFVQGGTDYTKSRDDKDIIINDELGIGLKFYDENSNKKHTSIVYEAIEKINKKTEFAEILRLLYVGLTRAKEYLYVYGTVDKFLPEEKFENNGEITSSKTFLNLIMGSFDKKDKQKLLSQKQTSFEVDGQKVRFELYQNKDIVFDSGLEDVKFAFEKQTNKNLEQSIFYTYPKQEVYFVPLKNSVTSILKAESYESFNPTPQKLTISEHSPNANTNAKTGILYHSILQNINFDNLTLEEVNEKINQLIEEEQKDKVQAEKVIQTALLAKELTKGLTLQKEKKFIMRVAHNEVANSNLADKVLVQGIIDLFAIKNNKAILIDYKLTNAGNDQTIINRYQKQMFLYKKALTLAYNLDDVDCYIIDINRAKVIKVNA